MTEGRTRLRGGAPRTATWVWIEDGWLMVDFYDYGEAAHAIFGNDVATVLRVDLAAASASAGCPITGLCAWLAEQFESYDPLKAWLEANHIPFTLNFETWA